MAVFRAIILAGALAGLICGLAMTGLQRIGTVPLILQAETYEHDHGDEDHVWQPAEGFERTAYTALFNIVEWIGFGFLLTGAMVVSKRETGWREGFLWGLAGFICVLLAPSLGLPPELPGVPAPALEPRQLWWLLTAGATASGLALIVFKPSPPAAILAVVVICIPHLIGAPHLDHVETEVPETLSHQFTVAVTLTTFACWSLLGGLTGYFHRRFQA